MDEKKHPGDKIKEFNDRVKEGIDASLKETKELFQKSAEVITNTSNQVINNTMSSLDKFADVVADKTKEGFANTKQASMNIIKNAETTFTKFTTDAGRFFEKNSQDLIGLGSGILMGISISKLMDKLNFAKQSNNNNNDNDNKNASNIYLKIQNDVNSVSKDDWTAFIANISRNLEIQIKFRINMDLTYKTNLGELLEKAADKGIFTQDEIIKLDNFRNQRNKILHGAKDRPKDFETILWAYRFSENLGKEKISGIKD